MLGLVISTIVFFVASWYIKQYLDEQEIPKGMTRGILVSTLATAASWGAWALINWTQTKIEGPQAASAASPTSEDLSKLLKEVSKPHQ